MSDKPAIHTVIYIPGLGDRRVRGQRLALRLWRLQGVSAELLQMNWHDDEPYEAKLGRILRRIDDLRAAGGQVSLAAASAGASIAVNAYVLRKQDIRGLVSFCGKLQAKGVSSVHASVYARNRAFLESMQQLAASEPQLDDDDRSRILSLHPLADPSVPVKETMLPGATIRQMPVVGHAAGIAYGLTAGSRQAVRFLKQCAARQARHA